jgi:hypothetical protein
MTVLPAPESDGAPPLQLEAIDQSLLADPFQEISALAGTPMSASQQPRYVVAVTAKRVVSVTEVIPMGEWCEEVVGRRGPTPGERISRRHAAPSMSPVDEEKQKTRESSATAQRMH